MDTDFIDNGLKRKIKSSSIFDDLIEKSSCKSTGLGTGDTFLSINLIADLAKKYHQQTKRIAKKLQSSNLAQTIQNIYHFLYTHIQYKADGFNQNISSPRCTYAKRKTGVDCKSFSLFSSSLLLNLGVNHYIRKIKQPGFNETEFTHVYIVVPKDQKTNDLKKGYYVIDATTHDNQEGVFVEKYDIFMEAMPHFGLNGLNKRTRTFIKGSKGFSEALNQCGRLRKGFTFEKGGKAVTFHGLKAGSPINQGLKAIDDLAIILFDAGVPRSVVNAMRERINRFVASGIDPTVSISTTGVVVEGELFRFQQPGAPKVNIPQLVVQVRKPGLNGLFDDILQSEGSNWFSGALSSIGGLFGGSSGFYKDSHVIDNANRMHSEHLKVVQEMNNALAADNQSQFMNRLTYLKGIAPLIQKTYTAKKAEFPSGATGANLQASADLAAKYKSRLVLALDAWLNEFFVRDISIPATIVTLTSARWEEDKGFFGMFLGTPQQVTQSQGEFKRGNKSIPAFQLNQEFLDSVINNTNLNTSSFLGKLTNIIVQVAGGAISPNNPTGSSTTSTGSGNISTGTVNQQQASILGKNALFGIAAAAGIGFGMWQFSKNKKTKNG